MPRATAVPAGLDDPRRAGRAHADRGHPAEPLASQLLLVAHRDSEVAQQRHGLLGQPVRGLDQRWGVDQVARRCGRRRCRDGIGERTLQGKDLRADDRDVLQRRWRRADIQREGVRREQRALDEPAQAVRAEREAAQVDRERHRALGPAGRCGPGLAQRSRAAVTRAEQQDPLGRPTVEHRDDHQLTGNALGGLPGEQRRNVGAGERHELSQQGRDAIHRCGRERDDGGLGQGRRQPHRRQGSFPGGARSWHPTT